MHAFTENVFAGRVRIIIAFLSGLLAGILQSGWMNWALWMLLCAFMSKCKHDLELTINVPCLVVLEEFQYGAVL